MWQMEEAIFKKRYYTGDFEVSVLTRITIISFNCAEKQEEDQQNINFFF